MNSSKSKKIFCADDDPDDIHLLKEALTAVGSDFQFIHAQNGEDALKQLRQMKTSGELPCLIVLDVNMPKIDGRQTLVALQSDMELSSVPVVIFTTSSSAADKLFFSNRNVEFITKPVDINTFYNTAHRLLNFCK